MPVPKKRSSRTRKAMRNAHAALSRTYSMVCPNCAAPVLRHRACMSCGQYRGKSVVKMASQDVAPTAGQES